MPISITCPEHAGSILPHPTKRGCLRHPRSPRCQPSSAITSLDTAAIEETFATGYSPKEPMGGITALPTASTCAPKQELLISSSRPRQRSQHGEHHPKQWPEWKLVAGSRLLLVRFPVNFRLPAQLNAHSIGIPYSTCEGDGCTAVAVDFADEPCGLWKFVFCSWIGQEQLFRLTRHPWETYNLRKVSTFVAVTSHFGQTLVQHFETDQRGSIWVKDGHSVIGWLTPTFATNFPCKYKSDVQDND